MTTEIRSNEEIREDLRRAASTATGFCHDAAMRLADDFESLLARIAAVARDGVRAARIGKELAYAAENYVALTELRDIENTLRAALAASPTPTTAEAVDPRRLIDPELAHGPESSVREMRELRADLAAERDGMASS